MKPERRLATNRTPSTGAGIKPRQQEVDVVLSPLAPAADGVMTDTAEPSPGPPSHLPLVVRLIVIKLGRWEGDLGDADRVVNEWSKTVY